MSEFDPYHRWLGIPPAEQPPSHYRLLGVQEFESDPDAIDAAAEQRMIFLRMQQTGKHADLAAQLLNEVARARLCLLVPARKAAYDEELRRCEKPSPARRDAILDSGSVSPEVFGLNETSRPLPPAAIVCEPMTLWRSKHFRIAVCAGGIVLLVAFVLALVPPTCHGTSSTPTARGGRSPLDTGPSGTQDPGSKAVTPAPGRRIRDSGPAVPGPVPPKASSAAKVKPEHNDPPPAPDRLEKGGQERTLPSHGPSLPLPVPDRESQRSAERQVREELELEPDSEAESASLTATEKLLAVASDLDRESPVRFAAFQMANECAVRAEHCELACFVVEEWGRAFAIDTIQAKLESLKRFRKAQRLQARIVAEEAFAAGEEATAAKRSEEARALRKLALDMSSRALMGNERLAGRRIVNRADGSELVFVPGGKFVLGEDRYSVERSSYFIGLHEVTNGQYRRFVEATGHRAPLEGIDPDSPGALKPNPAWPGGKLRPEMADHPVTCVRYEDAEAYCRWAGLRLPTEVEWEKAARGSNGRQFPWGDKWDAAKCVNRGNPGPDCTCPVLGFLSDRSQWGVLQMAGNVREWCSGDSEGVVRGGSWYEGLQPAFRCTSREPREPEETAWNLGFRVAQDAP